MKIYLSKSQNFINRKPTRWTRWTSFLFVNYINLATIPNSFQIFVTFSNNINFEMNNFIKKKLIK